MPADETYEVSIIVPETSGPPPPVWGPPYSQAELDDAQARFGLVFPPDLVALLREHRLAQALDWTRDDERIRAMLEWPFEGLLFDVENAGLWWPEWGPRPDTVEARAEGLRPDTVEARAEGLRAAVQAAPKLIPVFSHRYIPETPSDAGNPVFSVHQSDVIHYGADLADYVWREFHAPTPGQLDAPPPVRFIPFWSELVARAGYNTIAERDAALRPLSR